MKNTTTDSVLKSGQEVTVWDDIHYEWKDSSVGEPWFYVRQAKNGEDHIVACEGINYRVSGDEILELVEG
tara:strand:+ start:549 stop:758 length:210 start_codon:yes stop_codon:yes gene_type:complete